mgnify:CR=1 FL=1
MKNTHVFVTISARGIDGRLFRVRRRRFTDRRKAIAFGRRYNTLSGPFAQSVEVTDSNGATVAWRNGFGTNRWCYA